MRAAGHRAASRNVSAPVPHPNSMIRPWYAGGTGAIIFEIRNRCDGTIPPVCTLFATPAQKNRKHPGKSANGP
jgi:hypothetical protein